MDIKQPGDGTLAIRSPSEAMDLWYIGGPKNPSTGCSSSSSSTTNASCGQNYHPKTTVKIPCFNGTAGVTGALAIWVNPFNETLLVTNTVVDIPTGQATSFNISVGTGTLSSGLFTPGAVPLGNNLIDTANYAGGKTAALLNNIDGHGTNGKNSQRLASGQAIIVTNQSSGALLTAVLNVYFDVMKE